MEFTIRIKKGKNGWLCGQCEQIPEAISQGKNMDELMFMMEDAIKFVLECRRDDFRENIENEDTIVKKLYVNNETNTAVKTFSRKRMQPA